MKNKQPKLNVISLKKVNTERGNFVDNMGVLFVMAFVFALLLAFISYAKMIQMKLDVDHIAKQYLYIMEQYGYLPSDINGNTEQTIKEALAKAGCDPDSFVLNKSVTQYGSFKQVEYGDSVSFCFYVKGKNPLYTYLHGNPEDNWFFQQWINQYVDINVHVTSTSKW